MKRIFFISLLAFSSNTKASELLSVPSIPTVPGETGHLYLNKETVLIHPFSNDMGGRTDKFFTFGSYLGLLKAYKNFGIEHRLSWRMITPSFQDSKKTKLRKVPTGRYADWLEFQSGIAYNLEKYGLAINYGLGKLGNNNAKQAQHWWHNQFNIKSNKRLKWDNQLIGYKNSYGGEVRVSIKNNNINSFGYQKNILLEEIYIRHNQLLSFNDNLYSLEVFASKLLKSELNKNHKNNRHEITVGGKFFNYYTPSIKYVSPYINGESCSQVYYDILNFQIDL